MSGDDFDFSEAVLELEQDLQRASLDAADYGVEAMQQHHPYQDRTYALSGGMHVEPDDEEAVMVIPADYASFVDKGTSRSRAYPFTPLGEHAAEEALEQSVARALQAFAQKVTG